MNRRKPQLTRTGSNILGNNLVKAISNTFCWCFVFGNGISCGNAFNDPESNHKNDCFPNDSIAIFSLQNTSEET